MSGFANIFGLIIWLWSNESMHPYYHCEISRTKNTQNNTNMLAICCFWWTSVLSFNIVQIVWLLMKYRRLYMLYSSFFFSFNAVHLSIQLKANKILMEFQIWTANKGTIYFCEFHRWHSHKTVLHFFSNVLVHTYFFLPLVSVNTYFSALRLHTDWRIFYTGHKLMPLRF